MFELAVSAMLGIFYGIPFFMPSILFPLSIISLVFLFFIQTKSEINLIKISLAGYLFGFSAFGVHLIWILNLLIAHANISKIYSFILYLLFISILSLETAIWFLVVSFFSKYFKSFYSKLTIFILGTILFFRFLFFYGFWFLGAEVGYPLFSPICLLSGQKWFLSIIYLLNCIFLFNFPSNFFSNFINPIKIKSCRVVDDAFFLPFNLPINLYYIQPDLDPELNSDIKILTQRILQKIARLKLYDSKDENLIVMPEATYPFPLNENIDLVKMWLILLGENSKILIGGTRSQNLPYKTDKKYYQSTFLLNQSGVTDFYDKTTPAPICEKIPKTLRNCLLGRLQTLFLADRFQLSKGRQSKNKIFKINNNFFLVPRICSELFWTRSKQNKSFEKNNFIIWQIKESWLMSYIHTLMENYLNFFVLNNNISVILVGYFKVAFVCPNL